MTSTPRNWKIRIPIRPKCVQSVRGERGVFHVDSKVRKWKDAIRPYIQEACKEPPSDKPIRVVNFVYTFRCPKNVKKSIRRMIESGVEIPYLGNADITDNMNKGVVDVCAGLVFTNDRNIWKICHIKKVYGLEDSIYLEFEETPGVTLIDGTEV